MLMGLWEKEIGVGKLWISNEKQRKGAWFPSRFSV